MTSSLQGGAYVTISLRGGAYVTISGRGGAYETKVMWKDNRLLQGVVEKFGDRAALWMGGDSICVAGGCVAGKILWWREPMEKPIDV